MIRLKLKGWFQWNLHISTWNTRMLISLEIVVLLKSVSFLGIGDWITLSTFHACQWSAWSKDPYQGMIVFFLKFEIEIWTMYLCWLRVDWEWIESWLDILRANVKCYTIQIYLFLSFPFITPISNISNGIPDSVIDYSYLVPIRKQKNCLNYPKCRINSSI